MNSKKRAVELQVHPVGVGRAQILTRLFIVKGSFTITHDVIESPTGVLTYDKCVLMLVFSLLIGVSSTKPPVVM